MASTASVLQGVATELVGVGSSAQSACSCCCLPAGVEGEVMARASAIESTLGAIASGLRAQATDVADRGAIAANDSLPTATSSASGPGSGPPRSLAPPATEPDMLTYYDANGQVVMLPRYTTSVVGGDASFMALQPATYGTSVVGGDASFMAPQDDYGLSAFMARTELGNLLGSSHLSSPGVPSPSTGSGGSMALFNLNDQIFSGGMIQVVPSIYEVNNQRRADGLVTLSPTDYSSQYPGGSNWS